MAEYNNENEIEIQLRSTIDYLELKIEVGESG